MSCYDYRVSASLELQGVPFYALIMAAALRADTTNLAKLRRAWPEVVAELEARYNAPGGLLPGEAVTGCSLPHIVLPGLLAQAWDEGYRLDWTGGVRHPNPYRQEAESA